MTTSPPRRTWDPDQYRKFAEERAQPFHDLLAMVDGTGFTHAVDLGCGPGELTALAAGHLDIADMEGIDNSPAMIESAAEYATDRIRFTLGDIASWTSDGDHQLVLAAASLQWVPDHPRVIERWTRALAPGGQLAVQVPDNAASITHLTAAATARAEPYLSAFGRDGPPVDPVASNVLAPEQYSQILFDLGYERQRVELVVYPHVLADTRAAVEWMKGTSLTRFASLLPADLFDRFVVEFEERLVAEAGWHEPFFFPFRRILFWAQRP